MVTGVNLIVHNDLLEVLLGTGLVGIGLYLTTLAALFSRLRNLTRCAPEAPMRLIGCLGLMALASFFIGNFRQMIQAVFPL
jgi:O-antigen ligase